jgi:hypothetical protein
VAYQQIAKSNKLAKKRGVPRLSRTINEKVESMDMHESEILGWLHIAAKRNLFGEGSWPADDETKRTYWLIFERYLSTRITSDAWYLNQFGREIDTNSLAAFIGVDPEACLTAFDWDRAGEAELEDLFDDLLEGADEDRGNELTKHYLRGAYIRYCAARGLHPFAN